MKPVHLRHQQNHHLEKQHATREKKTTDQNLVDVAEHTTKKYLLHAPKNPEIEETEGIEGIHAIGNPEIGILEKEILEIEEIPAT